MKSTFKRWEGAYTEGEEGKSLIGFEGVERQLDDDEKRGWTKGHSKKRGESDAKVKGKEAIASSR